MKQALFILIVITHSLALVGQTIWTNKRDSLLKELGREKEDTFKVWTLLHLGELYMNKDVDSVDYYAKAFGILSSKLNFTIGKAYSLSMQAIIFSNHAQVDEAIALDQQAIEMMKESPRKKALANLYNNIATAYNNKGDENACIDSYLKAESLFEQLNDSPHMAMVFGNLSSAYLALLESEDAYLFALKGINLCRSLHSDYSLGVTLLNLGSALVNLQRFDTAIVVLNQANEALTIAHGKGPDPMALHLIDLSYAGLGKFNHIKANAEKIMADAKTNDDNEAMCFALCDFVTYYLHEKKYLEARRFAGDFVELAKKINDPIQISSACNQAAAVEVGLANPEKYSYYIGQRDSIDEAVRSDKILRSTKELEAKYSLNQKQAEIDNLNKQKKIDQLTLRQRNILNWTLASIVLVAFLIVFLYYRNYRQKKKLLLAGAMLQQQRITELEKEKQLLAAQAVLQGQIEERTRLAKDLHDGLGSILSSAKYSFSNMKDNLIITPENAAAFEKSMSMLDKSISELRRVAHNMMPEALTKFGLDTALKDFCKSVDQTGAVHLTYQSFALDEATISELSSSAVYRIIQELVNNILKHAHATTALVQLIRKENALSITVEDNGSGFDTGILQNNNGMGYLNLQNRVNYMKGTIDIHTSADKGTSVNIEIPNIKA